MSPIVFVIVACEIGFWVLVFGGLSLRYILKAQRLSQLVLWLVPLVDLILLGAVALDINRGTPVSTVHRVAGVYLGMTVAFGHSMIAWADVRFRHWFADGPAPTKPDKGMPAFLAEVKSFVRWLLAAGVAVLATLGIALTVANSEQRTELMGIFPMLGIVTVIWLLTGPVWNAFDVKRSQT